MAVTTPTDDICTIASEDTNLSGYQSKMEPRDEILDYGFVMQFLSYEEMNYILNNHANWLTYAKDAISQLSGSSTGNISDIETNAANITTNAGNIATNTQDITDLTTRVATNETNISTLQSTTSTNTDNIAINASAIQDNADAIDSNTDDIATNTSNISTNTTNIATNTTNIATNTSDISSLKSSVSANKTNISTNTSNIATVSGNLSSLKTSLANTIFEACWPVGSVYTNYSDSSNPNTLLSGGSDSTWVAITGRVIIGVGSVTDINSDTETYSAEETGGELNHTQTEDELVAHTHTVPTASADSNNTQGSVDPAATSTTYHTTTTSSTGGGEGMNVVQPYQTAYIWRRTA